MSTLASDKKISLPCIVSQLPCPLIQLRDVPFIALETHNLPALRESLWLAHSMVVTSRSMPANGPASGLSSRRDRAVTG